MATTDNEQAVAVPAKTGATSETIKLKITPLDNAPAFVAGLSFSKGVVKTVTINRERAQTLRRTAGLKIEEVK